MLPINIQLSKIRIPANTQKDIHPGSKLVGCHHHSLRVVGLDRIELSTSPLSGVRSSQLSYRPKPVKSSVLREKAGGAERDRTDDLLNANQALSQLSYSPLSRFPELSFPSPGTRVLCRGQLDVSCQLIKVNQRNH